MTRSTVAYSDKYINASERMVFPCGANFPRSVHRKDRNDHDIYGVLLEPASTNELLNSNDLSLWSTTGSPTITANSTDILDPEGGNTSTKVEGLGAVGVTDVYQSLGAGTFSSSASIPVGLWIYPIGDGVLDISNYQAIGFGRWNLDLSCLQASMWSWVAQGNKCFDDCVTVVNPMVSASNGAAGLAIGKFSGTSVDCYIYIIQQEESNISTSSIVTAGSAVTRAADSSIRYSFPYEDRKQGAIVFDFLFPNTTLASDVNIVQISDGGSSSDRILISAAATTGYLKIASAASGGSAGSVTVNVDLCSNEIKRCMCMWKNGRLSAAVMDIDTGAVTYGTDDTTVDISDDIDRLDLLASGGVISNVSLYPRFSHSFRRLANG